MRCLVIVSPTDVKVSNVGRGSPLFAELLCSAPGFHLTDVVDMGRAHL